MGKLLSTIELPIRAFEPQKALEALDLTSVDKGGKFHVDMDSPEKFMQIFDSVGWMVRQANIVPQATYKLLERTVSPRDEKAVALLEAYKEVNGEGKYNYPSGAIKYRYDDHNLALTKEHGKTTDHPGGYGYTSSKGALSAFDWIHQWQLAWAGQLKKQLNNQGFVYVEGVEGALRQEVAEFLKAGNWKIEGEGEGRFIRYAPKEGDPIQLRVRDYSKVSANIITGDGWKDTEFSITPEDLSSLYGAEANVKLPIIQSGARHLCIMNAGSTSNIEMPNEEKIKESKPLGWFIATNSLKPQILTDWEATRLAALDVEQQGFNRRPFEQQAHQKDNDFGDSHAMINAALRQSWYLLESLQKNYNFNPAAEESIRTSLEKYRNQLAASPEAKEKYIMPLVLLHSAAMMALPAFPFYSPEKMGTKEKKRDELDPKQLIYPRSWGAPDFPRGMPERLGQYALPSIAKFFKLELDGKPIEFHSSRIPNITLQTEEQFSIMLSAAALNLENLLVNVFATGAKEYGQEKAYYGTLEGIGRSLYLMDKSKIDDRLTAQEFVQEVVRLCPRPLNKPAVTSLNPEALDLKEYLRNVTGLGIVEDACIALHKKARTVADLKDDKNFIHALKTLVNVAKTIEASQCVRRDHHAISSGMLAALYSLQPELKDKRKMR